MTGCMGGPGAGVAPALFNVNGATGDDPGTGSGNPDQLKGDENTDGSGGNPSTGTPPPSGSSTDPSGNDGGTAGNVVAKVAPPQPSQNGMGEDKKPAPHADPDNNEYLMELENPSTDTNYNSYVNTTTYVGSPVDRTTVTGNGIVVSPSTSNINPH